MAGAALVSFTNTYPLSVTGMILLGIGYAACFPVALALIGDRFSDSSGTAFSIAFVFALFGNMTINKTMGHIAQNHGIGQFPTVLLAALTLIALLLRIALRAFQKPAEKLGTNMSSSSDAKPAQLPINPSIQ